MSNQGHMEIQLDIPMELRCRLEILANEKGLTAEEFAVQILEDMANKTND